MNGLTWVSCTQDADYTTSTRRHLVRSGPRKSLGALTTLCNATGMPGDVWRNNYDKPKCPACVEAAAQIKERA